MESLRGIENITNLENFVIETTAQDKSIGPILKCKKLQELFISYIWDKDNLLTIHKKFPEYKLD